MKREELDIVLNFLKVGKEIHFIGASNYAQMIYMINQDLNIVKEMEDHKHTLLPFMDYCLCNTYNKEQDLYDSIVNMLNVFNNVSEDKKWELTIDEFMEMIK